MPPYVGNTFSFVEVPITWDPSHIHSGYSLSNGNLTVTVTDDGGTRLANSSTRATLARNSGKRYVEIDTNCSHASQYGSVGLATNTETTNRYIGESTASWGYFTTGAVMHNGGPNLENPGLASYTSWLSHQPAWIGLAVDFDAGKVWISMTQHSIFTHAWQGGGDPAAGTTPSFTLTPNLTLYPAWTGSENTDYAIINSTTASLHRTAPTGFVSWARL